MESREQPSRISVPQLYTLHVTARGVCEGLRVSSTPHDEDGYIYDDVPLRRACEHYLAALDDARRAIRESRPPPLTRAQFKVLNTKHSLF